MIKPYKTHKPTIVSLLAKALKSLKSTNEYKRRCCAALGLKQVATSFNSSGFIAFPSVPEKRSTLLRHGCRTKLPDFFMKHIITDHFCIAHWCIFSISSYFHPLSDLITSTFILPCISLNSCTSTPSLANSTCVHSFHLQRLDESNRSITCHQWLQARQRTRPKEMSKLRFHLLHNNHNFLSHNLRIG